LPLIITYVNYKIIANPAQLSSYWPNALKTRISQETAKAIHIPFVKDALLDAIGQFSINGENQLNGAKNYYSEQAHKNFGVLSTLGTFINTLK